MRTKKEILNDELSENQINVIDAETNLRKNIYNAMVAYATEFHRYKSEQEAKDCGYAIIEEGTELYVYATKEEAEKKIKELNKIYEVDLEIVKIKNQ